MSTLAHLWPPRFPLGAALFERRIAATGCRRLPLCCLALLLAGPAPGLAQGTDDTTENVYLSGTEVRPPGPVTGDLVAAAGRIAVEHPVHGDAVLGAGSVDVRGEVGGDLRVASGVLNLRGRIKGDALIGAGSLTFARAAEVQGRAWLAGYDVALGGRFHRGLTVYAMNVLVYAQVTGDVRLVGETIEILPAARIPGKVIYKSNNEIKVHPGAQVGAIVREPGTLPRLELAGWPFRPLLMLGLLVAGALLLYLFPRFTTSAVHTLGTAPMKSLGLGTAIFFSVPPVILLLVITIIGIPIALVAAALHAVTLLAGYLVAAFSLGHLLLKTLHRPAAGYWLRIGSLALALLALWVVGNLPYAGVALVVLALIAGLGAMVLQAFTHYSGRPRSE